MRVLALLAVLAVPALATAAPSVTVEVGTIKGTGAVVVTGGGLTLDHMASETKGAVNCAGACTKIWIPLTASGAPTAGRGIDGKKLGTRKRPDGIVQVTYFGYGLSATHTTRSRATHGARASARTGSRSRRVASSRARPSTRIARPARAWRG